MAVIDWYSRRVLSWRLSNTLESDFCVEALEESMRLIWEAGNVRISMDGRERAFNPGIKPGLSYCYETQERKPP
ncbi:MAG: hypothetical protein A2X34_06810 [Elusimicrobia bacterium GWC2_51_8]|nr:MAG: hypothetical protein A2X33_00970 [Elusimicrobia bacterium GWA2_51_34]OGR61293.1 MAG: hypothetical protein A2X34_06810 [Elusimicrobia bacterium GWC2_51_8]OGR88554.1 MAG: hypothetical protein A2021_08535 [Elusimicrobia bacterium GWF2_52_66]HAF95483.1 hypothetical protein [Elusimicrobiota bacterium]HCE97223.1 hypothetical protein [Elusimicrobiota bacterium]